MALAVTENGVAAHSEKQMAEGVDAVVVVERETDRNV